MKAPNLDVYRPQSDADLTQVGLTRKAHPLVQAFQGRLPTEKELIDITTELGLEIAIMVLRLSINDTNAHGELLRRLRTMDFASWCRHRELASTVEVTVVASQLFQPGRRWGDHCDTWRDWARERGFTTESVDTEPGASVAENAQLLREFLVKNPHPRRILVTYGQGASEMRFLLRRRPGESFGVRAWLNVCGSFGGAASSDYWLANPLRKALAQARMKVAGRNPVALAETSSRFPFWREPVSVPRGMSLISVIGTPLRSQIPDGYHAIYHEVSKRIGPSDGMVGALQAAAPGGLVLAIDEMSHRAEDEKLRATLQRALGLLALDLVKADPADLDADFDHWLST